MNAVSHVNAYSGFLTCALLVHCGSVIAVPFSPILLVSSPVFSGCFSVSFIATSCGRHLTFELSCPFGSLAPSCFFRAGSPVLGVLGLELDFFLHFIMALSSSPLSIDIRCDGFPAGTVNHDVAKWLVDFFLDETGHKIMAVQELPGKVARVTFGEGGEAHKARFLSDGKVLIHGVEYVVVRPPHPLPPIPPWWYTTSGEIKDIRFQNWTNIPDVATGTRLVRMVRTKAIPRFLFVLGVRVKVWYKGQPVICDICRKEGHRAAACPLKGKCFRCHEVGHFSRD